METVHTFPGWVRRNFITIVLLLLLSASYFFLRLITVKDVPLFTDEAIYIRWAQMGFYDAGQRMASLSDGKQPLFIWLITILMLGISSPLAAGRMVSITAGFITAVGLFLLSWQLFKNTRVSILAAALYVFFPFALVYDRMALYESVSGMFLVWALLVGIILTKTLKTQFTFILALIIGGGILTKTTGFLSLYLSPLLFLLLPQKKKLMQWMWRIGVAIGLSLLYYSVLHLSPQFYQVQEKNALFLYHVSELLPYGAFGKWIPNLATVCHWLALYMGIPAFLVFVLSGYTLLSHWKEKSVLLLWFAIPCIAYGLLGRSLNPRYLFPIALPLLPLFAANVIDMFQKKTFKTLSMIFIVVTFASMLWTDKAIITTFASAPIPKEDLEQYINGEVAGGGIKESIQFLTEMATHGPIFVATEGIYGSLPTTAMELYFLHHSGVQKKGFEVTERIPGEFVRKSYEMPVYIVLNTAQTPPHWPMEPVAQYQKGVSNNYLRLYKLQQIPLDRCKPFQKPGLGTLIEECE